MTAVTKAVKADSRFLPSGPFIKASVWSTTRVLIDQRHIIHCRYDTGISYSVDCWTCSTLDSEQD